MSGYVPLRLFRSSRDPNRWSVVRNMPGERRRGAQEVEIPEAQSEQPHTFSRELEDA